MIIEIHLNDDAPKTAQFRHFYTFDAYGVRGIGSEIKSSKLDYASFALLTFPADKHETTGFIFRIHFCPFEHQII